ncbi:MAG: hypothetical protein AB1765_10690 [Candidatus Hydrogenedentota bacterium]
MVKKVILTIASTILFINPSYAGLFDDLTIISEKEIKEMQDEIVRLRDENAKLREENERLKKDMSVKQTRTFDKEEIEVLISVPEITDGDTEDYVQTESYDHWYAIVDFKTTKEIDSLKLTFNNDFVKTGITVSFYNERDERWQIEDDFSITDKEVTIRFRHPLVTNKLKLIPDRNIKNLNDLRILNLSVEGY